MEFEFDLKSFNHPLDNIDYIACYSHDGIKVGEEFTLNNGRVPARIIEKNGRKYIKTDAADWNIGLFVMKDILEGVCRIDHISCIGMKHTLWFSC